MLSGSLPGLFRPSNICLTNFYRQKILVARKVEATKIGKYRVIMVELAKHTRKRLRKIHTKRDVLENSKVSLFHGTQKSSLLVEPVKSLILSLQVVSMMSIS